MTLRQIGRIVGRELPFVLFVVASLVFLSRVARAQPAISTPNPQATAIGASILHGMAVACDVFGIVIVGRLTVPVVRTITNVTDWLDKLAPTPKRIIVLLVAGLLTAVVHVLAGVLPETFQPPSALAEYGNPLTVSSFLSGLIAFITHHDQEHRRGDTPSPGHP